VLNKAKDLASYIFQITQNSPVKFRWSIISKLQQYGLNLVEQIFLANELTGEQRLKFQKSALSQLSLLNYMVEFANQNDAIKSDKLPKVASKSQDVQNLLYAWIKSQTIKNQSSVMQNSSEGGEARQ
jgi:hypothetical protein